jgi:hypothetical protein
MRALPLKGFLARWLTAKRPNKSAVVKSGTVIGHCDTGVLFVIVAYLLAQQLPTQRPFARPLP